MRSELTGASSYTRLVGYLRHVIGYKQGKEELEVEYTRTQINRTVDKRTR